MDEAIVIFAGGAASRFPGKLEYPIAGRPMLAHTFERLRRGARPIYVCAKGTFSPELDACIDAPLLVDRGQPRGPMNALLDAAAALRHDWLFAVAADLPQIELSLLDALSRARQPGDEAVIPVRDGHLEPLAALYERRALLREAMPLRRRGAMAMHDLASALCVRRFDAQARYLHNVNRLTDLSGGAFA